MPSALPSPFDSRSGDAVLLPAPAPPGQSIDCPAGIHDSAFSYILYEGAGRAVPLRIFASVYETTKNSSFPGIQFKKKKEAVHERLIFPPREKTRGRLKGQGATDRVVQTRGGLAAVDGRGHLLPKTRATLNQEEGWDVDLREGLGRAAPELREGTQARLESSVGIRRPGRFKASLVPCGGR